MAVPDVGCAPAVRVWYLVYRVMVINMARFIRRFDPGGRILTPPPPIIMMSIIVLLYNFHIYLKCTASMLMCILFHCLLWLILHLSAGGG